MNKHLKCNFKMKIVVTAPGKAILHGEHAVLYGKAAVAVSLGLKTTVTLVTHEESKVILNLKSLGLKKVWNLNLFNDLSFNCNAGEVIPLNENCMKSIVDISDGNFSAEQEKLATWAFLYLWICITKSYTTGSFTPCIITVDSELAIGSGMGSSASYSVSLSAAILILCGSIMPTLPYIHKEFISKWAFEAEKIFHGTPSGIDNSVCTFGGAILFEKGAIVDKLQPDMFNIHILLVGTRVSRNTKVLVADLKNKQQLHSSVINSVMDAIHSISQESWKLLHMPVADEETLKNLINMNHHLLNCIGVGHPKLNLIHEIAQKHQCASKLTGAGGGGCGIILLPFKENGAATVTSTLIGELKSHNFDVWDILLGSSGVKVIS